MAKKILFYCVLVLLPFLILESAFRLLPVSNPPYLLPVSAQHPVVRYQPNVEYRYSMGWNFAIRTRMRSNNFGYNNVSDYHPEETTPLMTVIGDSFVEAQSVDSGKSAAELLNSALRGNGRVYSIGISGAPLSQYLAFAEFARDTFRPAAMTFFIIHNDYDESLLKYKSEPRFHYFAQDGDRLTLRRVDYERSPLKTILRQSALVRYVVLNVSLERMQYNLGQWLCRSDDPYACAGQAPEALAQRIADSQRAVDQFLDELPARSGLHADSLVFVVDAMRPEMYSPQALRKAEDGYVSQLRQYFMAQAKLRGHQVLDMQPVFMRRHGLDRSRFEAPTDGHWNELGNQLVADEIRHSTAFARIFGGAEERH